MCSASADVSSKLHGDNGSTLFCFSVKLGAAGCSCVAEGVYFSFRFLKNKRKTPALYRAILYTTVEILAPGSGPVNTNHVPFFFFFYGAVRENKDFIFFIHCREKPIFNHHSIFTTLYLVRNQDPYSDFCFSLCLTYSFIPSYVT